MRAAPITRRVRRLGWVLVAVTLVVVLGWQTGAWTSLTSWSRPQSGVRTDSNGSGLDVQPGVDLYPVGERREAPALEGTTLDDKRFALSDLDGRIVVINVWGSWCAPCRIETPDLVRVANEYADQGVRFVGIDIRDNRAAATAFVRAFKVPYPSVEDPDGRVLLGLGGALPVSVVPSTLVIDRQGTIAARIIGPVSYTTLTGIIDDELETAGSGR